jgi:hypothetical protein
MEAVWPTETLVFTSRSSRHYEPGGQHGYFYRREKLVSHFTKFNEKLSAVFSVSSGADGIDDNVLP